MECRSLPTPTRFSDRKAWPTPLPTLTRVYDRGCTNLYLQLFSDWRSRSRLRPTDRGHPLGEDLENRQSKQGRTLKSTAIPRTIHCTPTGQYRQDMSEGCPATFQACQNPSSVVSADVCPTVLWVPSIPMPSKHGKTPHMPLGINNVMGAINPHTRQTW